jgi:acetamidase/formamidase
MKPAALLLLIPLLAACASAPAPDASKAFTPDHRLTRDQTHNRWSAAIEPVLRVASGAVVEVETEEASDGQLTPDSTAAALRSLDFDPIHPLTGPIYVEGAEPGDVLKVTLLDIELGDWGWAAVVPGFGYLADEFPSPYLATWRFTPGQTHARLGDARIPLRPFPGVMGVAPDTTERLSTIPPRAHGGNMDDKDLTEGTVAYFPVFVEGALFSIGDTHAAQGDGEVSGTAIEAPMTVVLRLEVVKGGRRMAEPQYETADAYAVTAFGETLDEAAKKATRYMIDYLEAEHGMDRTEAYVLASLAADLKIAEVVDVPHVLVAMHLPKAVLGGGR